MKETIIKILILALVLSVFSAFIFTDLFPSAKTSEGIISNKLSDKNIPNRP